MFSPLAIVAVATAGAQAQPAAHFAPPLDRPMLLTITREQTEQGSTSHYSVTRRIAFTRDDDGGVAATLTTIAADGDDRSSGGARFEQAYSVLSGRAIRYRLDEDGAVTQIGDRKALWQTLVAGIADATAQGDSARAELARKVTDTLAQLPASEQRKLLAEMLRPAIETDAARRGVVPVTPIERPARPPFGGGELLRGTERAWRDGDLLVVEQRLTGDFRLPGEAHAAEAHVERRETRRIDPATKLLSESHSIVRTTIGGDTQVKKTTVTLLPAPVS